MDDKRTEEVQQEEVPKPLGDSKVEKTDDEKATHAKANAVAKAPMLELIMPAGRLIEVDGIPMEVIKVDGMTVTFKRKDILG